MINPRGLILIIIGIILLFRQVIEFLIKINNVARGTKTEITKLTILFYRAIALIFVIIGIIFQF